MNKNPNTKFRIIFLLSILCIGVVSIHALEPESPTVILGPPDIYRVAHRINFVGSPYKWTPQYALKDKITADGQAYLNPMIGPKGFVVEKTARNEFLLYSPYDMAIAQGWYQPPSGRFTVTNNLRGFFRSRNFHLDGNRRPWRA
ncbi:MAG: hypothetical protein WCD79_09725 [Chthoniobacteraceae bacterium]